MAEDAQASLAAAPGDFRAGGPGPGAEALRRAYLGVLKLALCDLVGSQTTSVGAVSSHAVMARELRGDGRRLRAAGMDWPLHGLTMVGLRRLDDLQACVEQVVADGVAGDLIEAGCWRGGASMLIRATLDACGEQRSVVVADSFQGFPASDDGAPVDHELLVAPLDDVREASRGSASTAAWSSSRASSRRPSRRSPSGPGRSCGSTPTRTRRRASRWTCSTRACRRAAC